MKYLLVSITAMVAIMLSSHKKHQVQIITSQKIFLTFVFAFTIFFISSCSYYEVKSFEGPHNPQWNRQLSGAESANRYFILNVPGQSYSMNKIAVDTQSGIIHFRPDSVTSDHKLYLQRAEKNSQDERYKRYQSQKNVLNEIHLYVNQIPVMNSDSMTTLRVDSLEVLKVIQKDKVSTTASVVLAFGIPLGLIAFIIIEAASHLTGL